MKLLVYLSICKLILANERSKDFDWYLNKTYNMRKGSTAVELISKNVDKENWNGKKAG